MILSKRASSSSSTLSGGNWCQSKGCVASNPIAHPDGRKFCRKHMPCMFPACLCTDSIKQNATG